MFSIMSKLVYDGVVVGLRVCIELSKETDKEEIIDLDIDLVNELEMDYNLVELQEQKLVLNSGVLATEEEHTSHKYVKNYESLYTSRDNLVCDLVQNIDTGEFSMGIKFGEINDCSLCPFEDDKEYCSVYPGDEPPCARFQELSFREYMCDCDTSRREFEKRLDLKEKEKREGRKREEKKKQAKLTRLRNRDINNKIKKLKKYKSTLEYIISYSTSVSSVNNLMGGGLNKEEDIKGVIELRDKIKMIDKKIEALVQERKDRNKQYRINNK